MGMQGDWQAQAHIPLAEKWSTPPATGIVGISNCLVIDYYGVLLRVTIAVTLVT